MTATAVPGDQQIKGTVRNGLPFTVHQAVVFAGMARVMVGDLGPGETQDWTVDTANRSFDTSGWDLWGEQFSRGGGFDENDGPVNLPLWQAAAGDNLMDERLATAVLAVGWTREWQPQLAVDGLEQAAPGRTAVLGRAAVAAPENRIPAPAVRREIVRGPFPSFFKGMVGGNGEATVAKFTLPPGTDPAGRKLVVKTTMPISAAEVWKDGNWQPLDGWLNGPNGVVVFGDKRAIIRGFAGGGGVAFDLPAPAPPAFAPTTMPPPAPGMSEPAAKPVPMPVPGQLAPDMVNGMALSELQIPDGAVVGGVVFIRFTMDPSMASPDAILTLGEAA